ncbi:MAG: DNA helicase RecQ [Muribaculaceae bacterium]|nr:DNA helicase RecQ [Muribaculaceae bacterium]
MTPAEETLKKYYGYSSFRPGQKEIIEQVSSGRDALVLMPTGGGKSLCYQIPALMLPGCAIVVSPLIALMNDQVEALCANGIPAAAIHSNRDEYTNRELLYDASQGRLKLLYISPERLMLELDHIVERLPISLIAIDEAHCISQWGHDFRPVYTQLSVLKQRFPNVPVMALTATADRLTREDIARALGLNNPFTYIGSFDRPNISLRVMNDPGKKQRLRIIASLIDKYHLDSGIVYCLSRKKTEAMHEALTEMGYKSVCYHAGLLPREREAAQKAFVNGEAQVVCATIAFGMGIDKSNIRWVVHNNIPGNIESYYQEIGRAGRDGLPAEALMFYNFADIITRRSFVDESGRREINNEKLDFMQRYAEATVCRRRILLSYFSEECIDDCGNCDNCRTPRQRFDGTILAQKALSAVIRVNNNEGIQTIVDILRASARKEILDKGYHMLRTYGAGRDLTPSEWNSYILQMIQLGLLEVAYEDNFHLRPTPLGMKVVKGLQKIELTIYEAPVYGKKTSARQEPKHVLSPDEQLLEQLKQLRKKLATEEKVADYVVFSDASLADMVTHQPEDIDAFADISGVSKVKLAKYGKKFLSVIRKHKGLKASPPIGTSQKETLILFDAGMSPEEIALLKKVSLSTIYTHLISWIDEGKLTDFRRLTTLEQYQTVSHLFDTDPDNAFSRLEGAMGIPGYIIRAVLAEKRARTS